MKPTAAKTLWLTGASGFLGSRLVEQIDPARYVVAPLSRSGARSNQSIDLSGERAPDHLREMAARDGAPDVVAHLAACKSPRATLSKYVRDNVLTTTNLLDVLTSLSPCHFLIVSTLSVYGAPLRNPVQSGDATHPLHPYGISKLVAEQLALGCPNVRSTTVLRLPSLYGVGQHESLLDGLAQRALQGGPLELFGQGAGVRDALHVSDAVRAILGALETFEDGARRVINVGCGRPISVKEWTSALVAALRVNVDVVPVGTPATQPFDLYADNGEAHRQFGFVPMSLTEAMQVFADELRS